MENSLETIQPKATSGYIGVFVFLFILCFPLSTTLYSQETSNNDYTGVWSDDASWIDGTSPALTVDGLDVDIYGYITLSGDFDYNNGLIEIFDTLVVEGNFTLQNNGNLRIGDNGILIVLGDYLSNNQVQVSSEGIIIAAGEFEMLGADNQGSFANSGTVYILDDTPEIKNGLEYVDLQCSDPGDYPVNCGFGNEEDIMNDPDLWDFFNYVRCRASDQSAPSITCPGNIVQCSDDTGGADITGIAPLALSDNCSATSMLDVSYAITGATNRSGKQDASGNFAIGTSTVEYLVTDQSGNITNCSFTVRVNPLPDILLEGEFSCNTGEILATASSSSGTSIDFSTDGGLSLTSTDTEAPFEFNSLINEGDSITLVARSINAITGCQSDWSAPLTLSANSLPVTGSIIADSPGIDHFDEVCASGSASYSIATKPGSTHNWSIPALSFSQEGTDQISVNWELEEGEYTIQVVEISENGCEGSLTEETVYLADPVVNLGGNQDICTGESYTFETEGDWASYLWYDGSTPPSSATQYTADRTLRINLTVTDDYGCTATDYAFLVLHENTSFNLGSDTSLCGESGYELEIDGFDSYEWSTGDISSSTLIYPGEQVVWLKATDRFGCSITDSITIFACEASAMFDAITNTFTPNNDGVNETWVIDNIELYPEADILVYDRFGRIVFEARNGYNNDWDGSLNGKPLPMDAYYYIIDFKSVRMEPITGALTIIL